MESQDFQMGSSDARCILLSSRTLSVPIAKLSRQRLKMWLKEYGDPGILCVQALSSSIHPLADAASNAALCTKDQEKFQEYGNLLFQAGGMVEAHRSFNYL